MPTWFRRSERQTIAGPSTPSWTCSAECCTERYPFFKGRSLATKYQLTLLLSDERLIADCSEEETSHHDCDHDHAKLGDAEEATVFAQMRKPALAQRIPGRDRERAVASV